MAAPGFLQPRWVEGELLVFSGGSASASSPSGRITAGAQLGFVWAAPGQKRFLILLNRLTLE